MKKLLTLALAMFISLVSLAQITPITVPYTSSACVGSTIVYEDTTLGGTWSSSNVAVASIGSTFSGGISDCYIVGVSTGTAFITYTVGSSFVTTTVAVVTPAPISGVTSICTGSTTTLSDVLGGGTWLSRNTSIATVDIFTGVVSGVSPGYDTIYYYCYCGCTAFTNFTVSSTTSAGTISGSLSVYTGATTALSETVSGGTWSSSSPSVASIDASTGVVTGIAPGTSTITYTVAGCSGAASATAVVTVSAFTGISGNIYFTGGPYYGPVKVWLIHLSYPMLSALDSIVVYCSGTSVYYQFTGAYASDSMRVKAALDTITSATYIPTYHFSSLYWNTATVFYHTSGTGDINKNITMMGGTPPAGTGFISGNVTTGANRGTTGGIPVAGLKMYLLDAMSTLLLSTRTDASGNYTFGSLPAGSYTVFPDSLNYLTTPYSGITLTSSAPSMSAAGFIQHTLSHTITPIGTFEKNINATDASVIAFPNPSNGKLHVAWSESASETAGISVTDITGRGVYHASIELTKGNGMKMIDLSNLADGLYLINIKSANVNYNNKLQIEH
jgi:hypothetical protein